MAKTICKAKKTGQVPSRGKPSVEWHKDGVPQYYCYGYVDKTTDELLEVCQQCPDQVYKAQEDLDKWNKEQEKKNGKADKKLEGTK